MDNKSTAMIAILIAIVGGLFVLTRTKFSGSSTQSCSGNNVAPNADGSCPKGYAQSGTQSGCCAPIPSGDVPSPCPAGYVDDSSVVGWCMPTGGSIKLVATPTFINTGQSVFVTAYVNPIQANQSVAFYDNDNNDYGTTLTNGNGVATMKITLYNNSSTNKTVVLYAGTNVNGVPIQSNGFAVVVAPKSAVNKGTYGLTCTRSGFYYCASGFGTYSETECNVIYANRIGKPCRGYIGMQGESL